MDMSGITLIPPEDRNGLAGVLILTLLVAFSCLVVGSMQAQIPQVTCGCLKGVQSYLPVLPILEHVWWNDCEHIRACTLQIASG